jgi:clan AA aspartic protease
VGEVRVRARIENAADIELVEAGVRAEVRFHEMEAVVDTGAAMLALPSEVVHKLGVRKIRSIVVSFADDRRAEVDVVGPVKLGIEGREMVLEAVVLPPTAEALIGQIPLEGMDLHVDCASRRLRPNPDSPVLPLLNLR